MRKPLVSIALATYNGAHFLRKQLDSLLVQTYSNFEIVVTDDGSIDATLLILEEYAKKDTRLRYSRSKLPRGFINNFTGAILECKGQIIFLCDQDDVWHKDKLAKHVERYTDENILWAYNKVRLVNATGEYLGSMTDSFPEYYSKKRRWILNYVWGSCILGCATSYRASAIKKLLPPDISAPAHDSWLQMALWPNEPATIDQVLQDYRVHDNNTSDFKLSRDEKQIKELELLAVKDNLFRLGMYSRNPRLTWFKRYFFLFVLVCKRIRLMYWSLRSIIIS